MLFEVAARGAVGFAFVARSLRRRIGILIVPFGEQLDGLLEKVTVARRDRRRAPGP